MSHETPKINDLKIELLSVHVEHKLKKSARLNSKTNDITYTMILNTTILESLCRTFLENKFVLAPRRRRKC